MTEKIFKLQLDQFVDLVTEIGGCFATDKITVDGMKVGRMYREEPNKEDKKWDSGWRFFSGTEDQEYVDNANNTMIIQLQIMTRQLFHT